MLCSAPAERSDCNVDGIAPSTDCDALAREPLEAMLIEPP
jgi:hypothetical protein